MSEYFPSMGVRTVSAREYATIIQMARKNEIFSPYIIAGMAMMSDEVLTTERNVPNPVTEIIFLPYESVYQYLPFSCL